MTPKKRSVLGAVRNLDRQSQPVDPAAQTGLGGLRSEFTEIPAERHIRTARAVKVRVGFPHAEINLSNLSHLDRGEAGHGQSVAPALSGGLL